MKSKTSVDILNCSLPSICLFWFLAGAGLAVLLISAQGTANWASALRVGSTNPARAQIESELGPLVSPDRTGHDGQLYYLLARDPFARGSTVAVLHSFDTNPPRYRYRRILYPLLAGGFGTFSGRTTLFAMGFLVAAGLGLTAVALADLAFQFRLPAGCAVLSLVNLGAFISAMMLTPDVLALGFSCLGVSLFFRGKSAWAIATFALAALTKEIYLLVPFSIAISQWRSRQPWLALLTLPAVPVTAWALVVMAIVPEAPPKVAYFSLPFAGLLGSVSRWFDRHSDNVFELIIAGYVAISFVAATVAAVVTRRRVLGLLVAPWLLLAILSTSIAVWDIPSNVARQFSILWPVSMLAIIDWLRRGEGDSASPVRATGT